MVADSLTQMGNGESETSMFTHFHAWCHMEHSNQYRILLIVLQLMKNNIKQWSASIGCPIFCYTWVRLLTWVVLFVSSYNCLPPLTLKRLVSCLQRCWTIACNKAGSRHAKSPLLSPKYPIQNILYIWHLYLLREILKIFYRKILQNLQEMWDMVSWLVLSRWNLACILTLPPVKIKRDNAVQVPFCTYHESCIVFVHNPLRPSDVYMRQYTRSPLFFTILW